jgi:hypothetical protein
MISAFSRPGIDAMTACLHVDGHACRQTVDVISWVAQSPSGSRNSCAGACRELHDLIFDGRAIARAHPVDLAAEQRGAVDFSRRMRWVT